MSENSEKEKSLSEKYFNCDADFFVVNKHIRIDTPKLFIFKQIQLFVCKIGACHMFLFSNISFIRSFDNKNRLKSPDVYDEVIDFFSVDLCEKNV